MYLVRAHVCWLLRNTFLSRPPAKTIHGFRLRIYRFKCVETYVKNAIERGSCCERVVF